MTEIREFTPFWIYVQDEIRGKGISNGVHHVEVQIGRRWVRIKFPNRTQAKRVTHKIWQGLPSVVDVGQTFPEVLPFLRKEQPNDSKGATCSIEALPQKRRRAFRRKPTFGR